MLKRLASDRFHVALLWILSNVTGKGIRESLPELPAKDPIFGHFPVRRIIKKDARANGAREKQYRGFVWMDGDPLQNLLNKCHSQTSCHNISDGCHRDGNYNYLYTPVACSLFAGKEHPGESEPVSPNKLPGWAHYYEGGEAHPFRVRPFQATGWVWIVWSHDGPVLHLGRVYDGCTDHPWRGDMVRYLKAHGRKLGMGVSIDSYVWPYIAASEHNPDRSDCFAVTPRSEELYCRPFTFLPGQKWYSWADGGWQWLSDRGMTFAMHVGRVIQRPDPERWESHFTRPSWPAHVSPGEIVHNEPEDGTAEEQEYDWHCSDCANGFMDDDDQTYIGGNGQVCNSCAENYSSCDHCSEYFGNDDIASVRRRSPWRSGWTEAYWCSDCRRGEAVECHACEEWVMEEEAEDLESENGQSIHFCSEECRAQWHHCPTCEDSCHREGDPFCHESAWDEDRGQCGDCISEGREAPEQEEAPAAVPPEQETISFARPELTPDLAGIG